MLKAAPFIKSLLVVQNDCFTPIMNLIIFQFYVHGIVEYKKPNPGISPEIMEWNNFIGL